MAQPRKRAALRGGTVTEGTDEYRDNQLHEMEGQIRELVLMVEAIVDHLGIERSTIGS